MKTNYVPELLLVLLASSIIATPVVTADLIAHWEFEEGDGTMAADSVGDADATLNNGVWGGDETRASFITFDGEPGSYGDPGLNLPIAFLSTTGNFTIAFWVNRAVGDTEPNSIVVGNRYDPDGLDYVPRQFVKFTPTKFEWHMEGNGNDNLDPGSDMVGGEWHHEAVTLTNGTAQYYRDGLPFGDPKAVTQSLSFDQPFYFGGQANTAGAGEFFNGSLDDIRLYDNALTAEEILEIVEGTNLPPSFTEDPMEGADATIGVAYAESLEGSAMDPNVGDTLTYSLVSGPSWLQLAEDGALTGTPAPGDAGYNVFAVEVSDGTGTDSATLVIQVIPNPGPGGDLFAWWPLNDGSGGTAADVSGGSLHAIIMNADTGGLNEDGSVWVDDPECGMVLSFNGVDNTGAYAVAGVPPIFGSLPVFTIDDNFTWSLWVKSAMEIEDTSIIFGNRRGPDGIDYDPREFIKFTGLAFEWHHTALPENVDYADMLPDVWTHLVIVKEGATLTHYRDGVLAESTTITAAPLNGQPIYFGGQGFENWRGSMSDVRLYKAALSEAEVAELFDNKGTATGSVLAFTDVSVDADRNVRLTWRSRGGKTYKLDSSTSMLPGGVIPGGWFEVDDGIESMGESTTHVLPGDQFPFPANELRMFFRVSEAD
ncbi:MAG: LamG-like jellyroll fold domain-containing protein [Verrucomicrobiales bacterium]